MAHQDSTLLTVCTAVADFIETALEAEANGIEVGIGIPAEAKPPAEAKHLLNLFFYRFEPSGFFPDTMPTDPWRIRLHCLITAFASADGGVGKGKHELGLLGEVMRVFHEHPVMPVIEANGESVQLQTVFQPLSSDELNHIWSTQSETSYRPSIVYEMALVPIVPSADRPLERLVGEIGAEVATLPNARTQEFSGEMRTPEVIRRVIDVHREDWAPAICAVLNDECHTVFSFQSGSDDLKNFFKADSSGAKIWVAGDPAATVELRWEKWGTRGWIPVGTETTAIPKGLVLDPEEEIPDDLAAIVKPVEPIETFDGQAVLYAVRSYKRSVDQFEVEVRSNPVLVSAYTPGPV